MKWFDANGTDVDAYPERAFQGGVYERRSEYYPLGSVHCIDSNPAIDKRKERMTYRDAILRSVNSRDGITGVTLNLNVMGMINPVVFVLQEYLDALIALQEAGDVLSIRYQLPNNRCVSLYLPKGAVIRGQARVEAGNTTEGSSI